MNWEKINQYYNCSMKIVKFVGVKNILFFGMLSTAISVNWLLDKSQKPYYGFHIFKRVKPTQTIYEHPY